MAGRWCGGRGQARNLLVQKKFLTTGTGNARNPNMNSKTVTMIAVLAVLLLGGAGFGIYTMKQNAPSFRGIGVNVKGQPEDVCEDWEAKLKDAVSRDDVLKWVVEHADYAAKMEVPAEEAYNDLKGRVTVRYKKKTDVIEVGLTGKRKEDEMLGEISNELYRVAASLVAKEDSSFSAFLNSKAGQ
jgi:capsular polysaccharide biosynthesis protein